MSKIFCNNCGSENEKFVSGKPSKFCSSCGTALNDLSSFSSSVEVDLMPSRRRVAKKPTDNDYSIDFGGSGFSKFSSIAYQNKVGLSRPKGNGGYKENCLKEFRDECQSSRNNPTDIN